MTGVFAYVTVEGQRGLWHAACDRVTFSENDVAAKWCPTCYEHVRDEVTMAERQAGRQGRRDPERRAS